MINDQLSLPFLYCTTRGRQTPVYQPIGHLWAFQALSSCSCALNDRTGKNQPVTLWSLAFRACTHWRMMSKKVQRLFCVEFSLLPFFPPSFFWTWFDARPSSPVLPLRQKKKQQNCSSGLIRRIGTRRESWRNIQISQRGEEFGGICQALWSEMNYANEMFGPGCLQKPLGRTKL